ncbi:MAG: class I adenylate-forming enzyme family protein, partial [Geminicoccaceae bacterium]
PKGVMLTHANLLFAGEASVHMRGMIADDVVYGALPISHVFGLASVVIASTHAGALIRLEPRFSPEHLHRALISGVTLLSAVPQMHAHLMQYTKEQGHERLPTRTLRYVSSGAAPLDPDWKRRAERFYGVPLQNGYGMTETTAGICLTRHERSNDDISVGKCFPGVEVKLDHQAKGAEGEVGEILVGGRGVMKGYFRNAEASDQAFTADGWLRTGDLGRFDAEGNLHVTGRAKELIIHGGFNVYPPEVEAVLSDHPQVIQCAVIGQKVGGDELICAFVEASPRGWPDEGALRAFAAERLAGYKRPSRIILMEKLPAAATGKILKHELFNLLPA